MSDEIRDRIRKNAFNNKFKTEVYVLEGDKIDIRQPSRGQWEDLVEAADGDMYKLQLLAVIDLCYVKGTKDKVFELANLEGLRACPIGGFVDDISKIILKMCNIGVDDAKKT